MMEKMMREKYEEEWRSDELRERDVHSVIMLMS